MQVRHSVQSMQTSQGPTRPLLTALEVQELLHIDRSTVYRMAEDGRLPAIRVGRSWRFPADRIDALLDSGPAEGTGQAPTSAASGSPAFSVVPRAGPRDRARRRHGPLSRPEPEHRGGERRGRGPPRISSA